jgi:outer membrane biogenesis lipoprotein LolB
MRSALVLLVVAVLILSACAPVAAPTATVPPDVAPIWWNVR